MITYCFAKSELP